MNVKRHFLGCFAIIVFTTTFAQSTITNSNSNPIFGEQFKVSVYSTMVMPGDSGANVTWDFTTIGSDSIVTWSSVAPQSGSQIAGANLNVLYSPQNYYCYNVSQTKKQITGIVVNGVVLTYSNPEDMFRYPMTYQNEYSDTWACTFTSSGYLIARTGKSVASIDGYGTLKLPNKTITNVLRLHYQQDYMDSLSQWSYNTYYVDEYMWLVQGENYPLLTISGLETYQGITYQANYLTNSNATNTFSAINDDTKRSYHIIGNTVVFDESNASVYTILGQCVSKDNTTVTLTKGIYIVRTPKETEKIVILQ